jgi:hypothetical protein
VTTADVASWSGATARKLRQLVALAAVTTLALVTMACASSGTINTAAGSAPEHLPRPARQLPQPVITAAMRDLAIPGPVVLVCTRTEECEAFATRVVRTHDPVQTGDHFRVGEG